MGAAKARVITRKIKLHVNFRIQKSGHTVGKDNSGEHLGLHNYVYDREDTRSGVKDELMFLRFVCWYYIRSIDDCEGKTNANGQGHGHGREC